MRRKEKWPGTVFHRLLDGSIFLTSTKIFPFPLTFRQEHFSGRIKTFLSPVTFRHGPFLDRKKGMLFKRLLGGSIFPDRTKTFLFPSRLEMVFLFNPSCCHYYYANPDCYFWLTRSNSDEYWHLRKYHCKKNYRSELCFGLNKVNFKVFYFKRWPIHLRTYHCKRNNDFGQKWALLWIKCVQFQSFLLQEKIRPNPKFNILSKRE